VEVKEFRDPDDHLRETEREKLASTADFLINEHSKFDKVCALYDELWPLQIFDENRA